MDTAIYDKLRVEHKEFRLLYLQPSKSPPSDKPDLDTTSARIACKLEVASLDSPPPYEALSYVWGKENDCVSIHLNDTPVTVTRNLYKALDRLVLPDQVRTLWADAICINQGDGDEKVQQVRQMKRIYESATTVQAFLGDPFPGVDDALDYLCAAADDTSAHIDAKQGPPQLSVRGLDAYSSLLAKALVQLFELPWWTRVWTVQEFILARAVEFHCGPRSVPASRIVSGVDSILHHGSSCCNPNETAFVSRQPDIGSVWAGFARLTSLAKQIESLAEAPFHRTLGRFRPRDCSRRRDRIYGALGLLSPREEEEGLVVPPLDYDCPLARVYEDFTLAYVRATRSLDILCYLGGVRALDDHDDEGGGGGGGGGGLPSFCPDWSIRPVPGLRDHDERWMVELVNRSSSHDRFYDAAAGSEAHWESVAVVVGAGAGAGASGGTMVRANGFVFDVVRAVLPRVLDLNKYGQSVEWLSGVLGLVREAGGDVRGGEDGPGAGAGGSSGSGGRELPSGEAADPPSQTPGGDDVVVPLGFVRALCGNLIRSKTSPWNEQIGDTPEDIALLRGWWDWFMSDEDSGVSDADLLRIDRCVSTMSIGRVFVITERGYFGYAERHAQPGDVVAVLGGGRTPFVLSPEPEAGDEPVRYKIVGDAYIHGIMNGEVFRLAGREVGNFDELLLI